MWRLFLQGLPSFSCYTSPFIICTQLLLLTVPATVCLHVSFAPASLLVQALHKALCSLPTSFPALSHIPGLSESGFRIRGTHSLEKALFRTAVLCTLHICPSPGPGQSLDTGIDSGSALPSGKLGVSLASLSPSSIT